MWIPDAANKKECSRCELILPYSAFHKARNTKDGHNYYCKRCRKIWIKTPRIPGALISHATNLVGRRFSRLVVLGRAPQPRKGHAFWYCLCDCGNTSITDGHGLTQGTTRSCGCLKLAAGKLVSISMKAFWADKKLPAEEAVFRQRFSTYKSAANKRRLVWELTEPQARKLFLGCCYYCGVPPSQKGSLKRNVGTFLYNGIDRFDNLVGYTLDNAVSCCRDCNTRKSNWTYEKFIDWIVRVATKHGDRAWTHSVA